ncbi:hypothetical protein CMR03_01145 [Pantoea allii]|nr:hypothetical protein CMR03_01145 [Pantoea allii]
MNFNIAVPTRLVLHIALKKVQAAREAPPLFLVYVLLVLDDIQVFIVGVIQWILTGIATHIRLH